MCYFIGMSIGFFIVRRPTSLTLHKGMCKFPESRLLLITIFLVLDLWLYNEGRKVKRKKEKAMERKNIN